MALVSHKYKFIYLKTYKTASSSTYQFFSKYCIRPGTNIKTMSLKRKTPRVSAWGTVGTRCKCRSINNWGAHINAQEVKEELGEEMFSEYFKFTTVRNPFDTAVSQFRHSKQPSAPSWHCSRRHENYDDFLTDELFDAEENWKIYTLDGVPACDYYIRHESLIEGVNHVLQTLGMDDPITAKDFPKLRKTKRNNVYKPYYKKEISFYNKIFEKELDFFDYKF